MALKSGTARGEVGHASEDQERGEPEVMLPGLSVGEERDAEPWNQPDVPAPKSESEPATPLAVHGSGLGKGRHDWAATVGRGSSTTTAVSVDRRTARASMSLPQPG